MGPRCEVPIIRLTALGGTVVKGEYDFFYQSTTANSSLPDISDVASTRLQAGISTQTESGISISLQGDVSGLGSDEFIVYGLPPM